MFFCDFFRQGVNSVDTWTSGLENSGLTLFDLDLTFFPINIVLGSFKHWVGAVVNFRRKQVYILDSLQRGNKNELYSENQNRQIDNIFQVTCDVYHSST